MNASAQRVRRVRVGVTLTLLASLLFMFVFSLDSTLSWFRDTERVQVWFPDVQGLRENDPVHFHGVTCGRVVAVRFHGGGAETPSAESTLPVAYAATDSNTADANNFGVVLELEVPRDVRQRLTSGSSARIEKTLTGVTVVKLMRGPGQPLTANTVLSGTAAVTIDDVTARLDEATVEATKALQAIRLTLEEVRAEKLVVETLRSLGSTAEEARHLVDEIRALVGENRASVRTFLTGLEATAQEAPQLVDSASDLTAEIRQWFLDARGDLSSTSEDIAGAADNLNKLSREIRRRPWRLLHSPSKAESLALGLYETVDRYATGAGDLRRSIDRMKQLVDYGLDEDGVREQFDTALGELESRLEEQRKREWTFWDQLEQLDVD